MSDDATKRYWDGHAATFDDEPDHGLTDPTVRAAWRELLSTVLPVQPSYVADLGAGTGTLSLLVAELGHHVTGIDISPEMVGRARDKASVSGVRPTPTFAVDDAADPRLEKGRYDVVLARHVTWALPNPRTALRRWVDLLVPGGRLVLVEGLWAAGAGIRASDLVSLVSPYAEQVQVTPMPHARFWGREITDERFLLTGRRSARPDR